jgi:hypothetical protein
MCVIVPEDLLMGQDREMEDSDSNKSWPSVGIG